MQYQSVKSEIAYRKEIPRLRTKSLRKRVMLKVSVREGSLESFFAQNVPCGTRRNSHIRQAGTGHQVQIWS